jgi:sporulation integral membrane protein YlbJ
MLGLPEAGIYLVVSHYLSAALVGVISGFFERKHLPPPKKTTLRGALRVFQRDIASSGPIGALLSDSVYNAVTTLLKIGGFIVFFFVVIEVLSVSGVIDFITRIYAPIAGLAGMSADDTRALLVGGIEMTAGCHEAAQLTTAMTQKLALISSIITFGGMSIHMQTRAVCADAHLPVKRLMLAKTLQAFFAYALCSLMLTALPLSVSTSTFAAPSKTAACTGIVFATAVLIFLIVAKRMHCAKHPANAP